MIAMTKELREFINRFNDCPDEFRGRLGRLWNYLVESKCGFLYGRKIRSLGKYRMNFIDIVYNLLKRKNDLRWSSSLQLSDYTDMTVPFDFEEMEGIVVYRSPNQYSPRAKNQKFYSIAHNFMMSWQRTKTILWLLEDLNIITILRGKRGPKGKPGVMSSIWLNPPGDWYFPDEKRVEDFPYLLSLLKDFGYQPPAIDNETYEKRHSVIDTDITKVLKARAIAFCLKR